jgi:carbon-monoxide dehydrogenase small subunit
MILLAKALLTANPAPDRATIRDWISANVCRCTGYQMIVEAVEDAARRMRETVR